MRRLLLILFLLIAFNFASAEITTPYIRRRQTIEYTSGVKFRELDETDYIKYKITNYIRLEMLRHKVEQINFLERQFAFN